MTQYLVTLKKGTDIDAFYNEMETSGGSSTIPDREVTCYKRKPISRTTGYDLEDSEVESLLNDDRVIGIDSQELLDSSVCEPSWEQTSNNWRKSQSISATDKNWALYRCILGSQLSNWGTDGTTSKSATVATTSSGKNVDVVIVDGHFDPNHPEFAVNPDGTGGTRVQQFNWLSLTSQAIGGSNGTYTYRSGTDLDNGDDNHGAHVAATVAGNTQGWARDANIYYISPYDRDPNVQVSFPDVFDYIRVWHSQKSVNPETGRKNPTIVNNSWGNWFNYARSDLSEINYRGTVDTTGSWTDAELQAYGIRKWIDDNGVTKIRHPVTDQFSQYLAEIEDAVDEGIILVGAASNHSEKIDIRNGNDYDNYMKFASNVPFYYNRGSWVTSSTKLDSNGINTIRLSVCVGAVSSLANESKATFSNCGPRVDVFAPGEDIISAVHGNTTNLGYGIATQDDQRNTSYKLAKYDGTSMASPQVCGVLACLLEQYPNMNQSDIMDYINQHAKDDQMTTTSGGVTDLTDLQGADNKYLFYHKERPETGVSIPRYTYRERKSTTNGVKYPRVNRMVTKPQ